MIWKLCMPNLDAKHFHIAAHFGFRVLVTALRRDRRVWVMNGDRLYAPSVHLNKDFWQIDRLVVCLQGWFVMLLVTFWKPKGIVTLECLGNAMPQCAKCGWTSRTNIDRRRRYFFDSQRGELLSCHSLSTTILILTPKPEPNVWPGCWNGWHWHRSFIGTCHKSVLRAFDHIWPIL